MVGATEMIVDKRFGELLDVRDFLVSSTGVRRIAELDIHSAIKEVINIQYPLTVRGDFDDSHSSHAFNLSGIPLLGIIFFSKNNYNYHDFWQFPHETLLHQIGDCEDTTILLGRILLEKDIIFRVNLGKVFYGEQFLGWHAWITTRLFGTAWFLIETTLDYVPQDWLKLPTEDLFAIAKYLNLTYEPIWVFDQINVYVKEGAENLTAKNVAAEPEKIRKIKEEWQN